MAASLPPRSVEEASLSPESGAREDATKAAAQEDQEPMVFLCAGCKRAVGDTLEWEANDESTRCLLLRSVSSTVTVDKQQKFSSWPEERGCMLETLFCSGCKMTLGSIYRCTPRHLDYKRDLYCLNIDCLESYTLGAAEQKADVDKEPLTLGSQAILEESLERAETALKTLGHRLSLIESAFQDVHVMIFVGFGFLMTFLQRYGFGAVGFNFLLAAFGIQWALLMQGWLHTFENGKILIGIESLIGADFCVGSVCIAFGAILGKVSPVQLLIMTLFQVTLFSVNEYILLDLLHVKDAGGSMTIHTFGAYFGLTVTAILYRPNLDQTKDKQGSVYHSDLFSMIGTLFLWIFWPSFNSAISNHGDAQHRAAINTYCSLAACVLTTVAFSSALEKKGRLNMVHIQNATLAGGVAVGTSAEMMLTPYGSLIVGFICGIVSTLGFVFATPFLESKLRIQDTCGIHNLHAMPGLIGGIVGAVTAAAATEEIYGPEGLISAFDFSGTYAYRNPSVQGEFQAAGIAVSLGMALIGGAIVGFLLKLPFFGDPTDENCFDDDVYWEVLEDEESSLYSLQDSNGKSPTSS